MADNIYYNFMVFVVLGLICALSIVNAVIYQRITNEKNESLTSLSPSGARALQWINIVIAVISGCFAIYYLYRVFFNREKRKELKERAAEYGSNLYRSARTGLSNVYNRGNDVGLYGGRNSPRRAMPSEYEMDMM
jgi:hypothetical protein